MNRIVTGECREVMRSMIRAGVRAHCVVTSPPYWGLRSYGTAPVVWGGDPACVHDWSTDTVLANIGQDNWTQAVNGRGEAQGDPAQFRHQAEAKAPRERASCAACGAWRGELGLEPSVFQYIAHMVEVFDLVREILHADGVCFVNIGDTYITRPNGGIGFNSTINGLDSQEAYRLARKETRRERGWPLKMKDMALVPQRLAIALQEAGWWVRQDIIWHKPNPMPGSYKDRFTSSHEYVWLLARSERYFFDDEAVKEPSSPNSHARMARAHGGYAPPGQDRHSGILAPRTNRKDLPEGQSRLADFRDAQRAGVNPKARDRRPSGWAEGDIDHKDLAGRYPRPKQNASFSAAVVDLVGMRRKRDVWTIPTAPYAGSHYATFPETLVEPCILSGTSARGHCPRCGAGWARVMGEPLAAAIGHRAGNKERKDRADYGGVPPGGAEAIGKQNQAFGVPWAPQVPVTIGWQPSCECHKRVRCLDVCLLQPVPAVVFDPFMGTGTVAKVAARLGRKFLGCDLDVKNEPLQHARLGGITQGLELA